MSVFSKKAEPLAPLENEDLASWGASFSTVSASMTDINQQKKSQKAPCHKRTNSTHLNSSACRFHCGRAEQARLQQLEGRAADLDARERDRMLYN